MAEAAAGSKAAVWAALIGNVLVAVTKAGAAVFTGSSAMLSEAVHSFVDTGNEVLLLYGMHRAKKKADRDHPVGYGRELYFWSFIVALLVFALGAGVSIYEGVHHVLHPEPIKNAIVSEVVLAAAFVFESWSWAVSLKHFNAAKGDLGYWEAFRKSKDAPLFMVLFEDSAALIGIAIAAVGTVLAAHFDMPLADGVSSILIGLVLACTSTLLARESKSLLIGERADNRLIASMLAIANAQCGPSKANGVLTIQMAPDEILAAMSFEFDDRLTAPQIEEMVADIEQRIQAAHPEVTSLFIKPQNPQQYTRTVRERFGENVAEATAAPQTPVASSAPP
ncbi:MAG: cation diffusion facilitator family transporter [Betaproteobacteria bacterium]